MTIQCKTIARRQSATQRAGFRGFTLMEVMFSVMILGVGLIAVASVLPVAGVLHRNTIDESESLAIGRTARGTLEARGLMRPPGTGDVRRIDFGPPITGGGTSTHPLPLIDRAYPSTPTQTPDPFHQFHRYYWVPLAYVPTPPGLEQVFVFIMRNPNYSYDPSMLSVTFANPLDGQAPRVVEYNLSAADRPNRILKMDSMSLSGANLYDKVGFGTGSRFLDNRGFVHTVQSVFDDGKDLVITVVDTWPSTTPAPTKIWFALADINGANPTLHIAAMGADGVLQP